MYLEKLEIQGFKSFAVKSSLEFRKGITAIVGPNGSGKSNVADAIRWVLGEQSLKTIRGKKAEDVIFAGSDKKTKLGAAEVSLYLNNEDGKAPIDFSELVITRRVYRDGTGEYLVNKRPVRLQDIQMLLAKSNFGQRTYSVIGQGMVDAILVTSPQERKHFFDEAAGVRQYQMKREQTISKLDSTRDNLRQAEILMQEIEPRLRSLTRQVKRLERRAEIEQELLGLQSTYYRGQLHDLRTQLSSTHTKLAAFEQERQQREGVVTQFNAQLSSREGEQTRSETFANLQRQYERIQSDKSVLLAEEAVLKGQRDVAFTQQGKTNVVWLEKQLGSLQQQLHDLASEEEALESSLKLEESKERALVVTEADKRHEYERLETELRKLHESLRAGAVTLPDVQSEFQDFLAFEQAFLDELRNAATLEQLEILRKRGDELENRTARLSERLQRLGAHDDASGIIDLQDALQRALAERDAAVRALAELQLAIRLKHEKRSLMVSNRERLNGEVARIERELARSKAETKDDVDATLKEQMHELAKKVSAVDQQLDTITVEMQSFNASETQKRDELFTLQRDLRTAQDKLNETTQAMNEVKIELARLETRQQDVEREIREEVQEEHWTSIFDSRETAPAPTQEQNDEIQRVKHQLGLIGGIDEGVEQEYKDTDERYTFLKTQYDDLTKASAQLELGIEELDRTIKERFDEAFEKINEHFGKYFRTLFNGGTAKLVLQREVVHAEVEPDEADEDEDDDEVQVAPVQPRGEKIITGIEIQATPPGKRLKGVAMLSGGERALTSIALICAIISNNPSPFVVLDEVDAALDEANSQRFAAILAHLAEKTQFVTITHNRSTMEKAGILYGVTMGDDGVSKLLSVKLEEAESVIEKFGNR